MEEFFFFGKIVNLAHGLKQLAVKELSSPERPGENELLSARTGFLVVTRGFEVEAFRTE